LFVYTTEAQLKEEPAKSILTEQLQFMQKKLWYIIGWPAMIGTFVFGFWMIIIKISLLTQAWMWLKLIAVLLLFFYHLFCEKIVRNQKKGIYSFTSSKLRLLNELPTIFLVSIVFLVVVKSVSGIIWGTLGLIAFSAVLIIAIML
jgi:putative membrane protein